MDTKTQWIITAPLLAVTAVWFLTADGNVDGQQTANTDGSARDFHEPKSEKKYIAPLKLGHFTCTKEYGYITIEGEVTNRTDKPINRLMAVGTFTNASDDLIKSATGMVEYQPLMPGQKSPYKVMASLNPLISQCHVAFKTMFGGQIATSR